MLNLRKKLNAPDAKNRFFYYLMYFEGLRTRNYYNRGFDQIRNTEIRGKNYNSIGKLFTYNFKDSHRRRDSSSWTSKNNGWERKRAKRLCIQFLFNNGAECGRIIKYYEHSTLSLLFTSSLKLTFFAQSSLKSSKREANVLYSHNIVKAILLNSQIPFLAIWFNNKKFTKKHISKIWQHSRRNKCLRRFAHMATI